MPARKPKANKHAAPKQKQVKATTTTHRVAQTVHCQQSAHEKRGKLKDKEKYNPDTLQAMADAKEGRIIKCSSFEDYLKSII